MDGERYVGERRALRHFLQELLPLVMAALGAEAVLRYRIDRALHAGDLPALRAAREMFHNQPEDLRRRASAVGASLAVPGAPRPRRRPARRGPHARRQRRSGLTGAPAVAIALLRAAASRQRAR